MPKPTAHIEDWGFIAGRLVGTISNHPQIPPGKVREGVTSTVVKYDLLLRWAETRNTIYTLGTRAKEIV